MKRPAFQFYPGDWQHDNALRACSICARGLWLEMICVMHQADPYGHLALNGQPMTAQMLAGMVGGATTRRNVEKWLAELREAGVYSVDEAGRIFSRRMVRDERVRDARAKGGVAGGVHGVKGTEFGKAGGRPRNETGDTRGDKKPPLNPPPSSAPSSAPSASPSQKPAAAPPGDPVKDEIWKTGKALLEAEGMSHERAGSFLGKLCKDFGQVLVLAAVRDCAKATPAVSSEWLVARCQERRAQGASNTPPLTPAMRCGNCARPIVGGYMDRTAKGRVCEPCWRGYMSPSSWPTAEAAEQTTDHERKSHG